MTFLFLGRAALVWTQLTPWSWWSAWKRPSEWACQIQKWQARPCGRLIQYTIISSKNAGIVFKLAERSINRREFTSSREQRQLGGAGVPHLSRNQLAQRQRSPWLADLRSDKRGNDQSARARHSGDPNVAQTSDQSAGVVSHLAFLPSQSRRPNQKL